MLIFHGDPDYYRNLHVATEFSEDVKNNFGQFFVENELTGTLKKKDLWFLRKNFDFQSKVLWKTAKSGN